MSLPYKGRSFEILDIDRNHAMIPAHTHKDTETSGGNRKQIISVGESKLTSCLIFKFSFIQQPKMYTGLYFIVLFAQFFVNNGIHDVHCLGFSLKIWSSMHEYCDIHAINMLL